ncbi:MAG: PTS sugar transporter subunit IIA [Candidatus Latescibacteria bacterium]|nr:PTS sugar transporter subunit IIA [Candidatus Latescibacterota bacterium]
MRNLASFFNPSYIVLGSSVKNKTEGVRFLVRLLAQDIHELDVDTICNTILERESLYPTTYANGVSIPHTRIPQYNNLTVLILIPEKPIWDGDHEIKIFFLVLTDQAKSNLYLNVMAGIAKLSQNPEWLDFIINAPTQQNFLDRVKSFGIKIESVIRIQDIMNTAYPKLSPDASVKDALDCISMTQKPYIPICGDNDELLGEITIHDIIAIGLPPYTNFMKNLSFLISLEPLEDMLKRESGIELHTIMRKPSIVLAPDTVIIEGLFQFLKNRHRSALPVAEGIYFKGVLSYLELVNNFLRV